MGSKRHLAASGIVVPGEGDGVDVTVLIAAGKKQRDLIDVKGQALREQESTRRKITDKYVPVGARSFSVDDAAGFKVGDTVFVRRMGNAQWIHFIAMDRITPRPSDPKSTNQWEPFELAFDRVITGIEGKRVTVDAPIACAIEQRWGGGAIAKYEDGERIEQVGVENLRSDSEFDPSVTAHHESG